MPNKQNRFYKCGKVQPELGDIVILNGSEVEVAHIRLADSGVAIDCSFDGKLCLDNPEEFDFVRRKLADDDQLTDN